MRTVEQWLQEYGVPGFLSSLGDTLLDVPTVEGDLKENLPSAAAPWTNIVDRLEVNPEACARR